LVLAGLGGTVGFAVAAGCIRVLTSLGTSLMRRDLGPGVSLPRLGEVHVDVATLAIVMLLAIVSAVIAGTWPALRLGGFAKVSDRVDYRSDRGASRQLTVLGPLIVAQVAVAVTLLVGSSLLIRSFANLIRVNLGFEAANVLTFRVSFPAGRYSHESLEAFSSRVVERIGVLPGVVVEASYTHFLPFVQASSGGRVSTQLKPPEDAATHDEGSPEWPNGMWVHQNFFQTLGVRISQGRGFTADDDATRPGVAVVNEALVRSGLLGSAPVGRIVYFGASPKPWEVVGVVDDFVRFGIAQPAKPEVYTDVRQRAALPGPPGLGPYILVKTSGRPLAFLPSMRSAVSSVDKDAAVLSIATMDDIVGNARSRPRLYTALMSLFAASALVIATLGIFGVVAYVVALGRREIGIRLSLGATPGRVVREFVMQASRRTAIGLLIGLGTATALARYLDSMLFGVGARDPWSVAAAAALLTSVMLAAAFFPAWRAAAVNPVEVLRAE
jgi:putative ABC transport system permease protein